MMSLADIRRVTLDDDVVTAKGKVIHKKGEVFITSSYLTANLTVGAEGRVHIDNKVDVKPFDAAKDWNGKRIMVHREGGAGDWIFISPMLREIKRRWPSCTLVCALGPGLVWIVDTNPDVDGTLPCPVPEKDFNTFDAHVFLDDVIEAHPKARELPAPQLFAAHAGLSLENSHGIFKPKPELVEAMKARFPRKGIPRVALQLYAGGAVRTYPMNFTLTLMGLLANNNIEVVMVAEPGKLNLGAGLGKQVKLENIINLADIIDPPMKWEEIIALAASCDAVIGPDSSTIHFAGAMNVPALGIYGSFPASLRVGMHPSITVMEGTGACAPCFHHGRKGQTWPTNGPCVKAGACTVLASVSPVEIAEKTLVILKPLRAARA